jgi:PTS system trehalose-specific IIC component
LPGILSIKPQFWLVYSAAIVVAVVIPMLLTIMVYKRKAARGELPV